MTEDDQRVWLMPALVERFEPGNAVWWKQMEKRDRLDERQVPGVAHAAAVREHAAVRLLVCDPRCLRRQQAADNQQHERQL
jgi:hypothetical protein